MQTSTLVRTVISGREPWIVFLATIGIGISVALVLYTLDSSSLIYYGDSISHLVRAREFIDSINPGLFEQLGTAWLPLPHLLLLPFTLIEPLFRTGFAGVALSLPCHAITSVILYKIIKTHLKIGYIAIAGALLYATNPNILYLGLTPMTETPFMLFFIAASYFFMRWLIGPMNYLYLKSGNKVKILGIGIFYPKRNSHNSYGPSSHIFLDLIMCSIFISFATLSRYEGWILPLFFVSFVLVTTLRKKDYYHSKRYKIGIVLASALSFSGIAFWLIWNAYAYNDPLEFANTPYFSAAAQALERPNRAFLYLQPWNVASLYGLTAFAIYGPVLLVTALLGYLFHRYLGKSDERRKRRNLYLFLAMPPLFTVISLLIGIGEMNQRQWFNSRFLILLAPLLISLSCIFLARLYTRFNNKRFYFAGIIFIFFAYQFLTPALGVVTFLNATYQFAGNRPFQLQAAEALSSAYDGNGTIVIITGSSQQNKIMQATDIPLRQFDQILESQSYKDSFKEPWWHSKYFILGKSPDASARNVASYWLDRQPLLEKYYDIIYEDKYYRIMVLSGEFESSEYGIASSGTDGNNIRMTPESEDGLLMHDHINLDVTLDGNLTVVPANIGIDPKLHNDHSLDIYGQQKSPLHTHTTSGTIHVESKIIANYTLGEFLDIWGLSLDDKIVRLTVDGLPVSDYRDHILRDGEGLHLTICSNNGSFYPDTC